MQMQWAVVPRAANATAQFLSCSGMAISEPGPNRCISDYTSVNFIEIVVTELLVFNSYKEKVTVTRYSVVVMALDFR